MNRRSFFKDLLVACAAPSILVATAGDRYRWYRFENEHIYRPLDYTGTWHYFDAVAWEAQIYKHGKLIAHWTSEDDDRSMECPGLSDVI